MTVRPLMLPRVPGRISIWSGVTITVSAIVVSSLVTCIVSVYRGCQSRDVQSLAVKGRGDHMSERQLAGRTALVTGSSRRIGREIVPARPSWRARRHRGGGDGAGGRRLRLRHRPDAARQWRVPDGVISLQRCRVGKGAGTTSPLEETIVRRAHQDAMRRTEINGV